MQQSDPSRARVLVMTADGALLASLRGALTDDYSVTTCDSPGAALVLVQSGRWFDLVIADPGAGMSGRELHDRLATLDPVLAHNMLLLSARRLSEDDEEFLDEHRVRVLPRSFGPERLRTELHALALRASLHRLAVGGA